MIVYYFVHFSNNSLHVITCVLVDSCNVLGCLDSTVCQIFITPEPDGSDYLCLQLFNTLSLRIQNSISIDYLQI